MNFGQQAPGYTLLQGKNQFLSKGDQKLNSTQKGNLDWFHDSLNPELHFENPPFDLGS
jgi:hypothetical protein